MIDNNIQTAGGYTYKYESIGGKGKRKGKKTLKKKTLKKKTLKKKTKKNKCSSCKRKKSTGIFYFLN
jgi:hypothetical protein